MHVLVEKPLAASLADCDAMLAAARSSGVKLGVISQRRWYEPVLRMKAAIDAGKIGRPVLGTFVMYSWRDPSYYRSDPWRGRWDTEGGGVLVNQSPHMLDLLTWLMDDEVAEVSGYWANLNHPSVEVEDTAVAILRFRERRPRARSSPAWRRSRASTPRCTSTGRTARASASRPTGARPSSPASRASPSRRSTTSGPSPARKTGSPHSRPRTARDFAAIDAVSHYHALQIHDFLRAIIEDRPPAVTGEDGRRVVELFQAIYRSNREGRSIRLPMT